MSSYDYNIVVIGGGSAGLVTAYIGSAVKAKTALIEKHKMGGDCLNTGCVPSKSLIASGKLAHLIDRHQEFGFDSAEYKVNFAEVMNRVQEIIAKIEPHDSVERYSGLGVECHSGMATIKSANEVEVNGKTLKTSHIVVATGAKPFIPPIPGIEEMEPLHSDNLWQLREQPKKLLVLGGGPIGSEMTQAFQRLGSEVTQIDMAPMILPREDDDISKYVYDAFIREGVNVITSAKVTRFEKGEPFNLAYYEQNGKELKVEFDRVLVAVGRKANTSGFGLEELGVKLTKQGTIEVDDYLRTSVKNIYACGDVVGPYQFTHTASHQAWYCAVNALFGKLKKFKVDYSVVPWCTYTDPEVAHVGLSEKDAKAKNIRYEVTTYDLEGLDRAITERENRGMVKVLTKPGKDKILGATIVGHHAGDLLAEYVLAMKYDIGLNKILGTIHTYPTMSEALKYAAGNWKKAHVNEGTLSFLEKFHGWLR